MSTTFKVPYTQIQSLEKHPNADRLSIAKCLGFEVVIRKDTYVIGDYVLFCPVDAVLPQWLENKIFSPESKIKLKNHRIRQTRIRGFPSQGMIIDPKDISDKINSLNKEQDYSEILEITKYEPPVKELPKGMQQSKKKKKENNNFKKYTDIENIKYYDRCLQDGEEVVASSKLHGTSFRAGWVKNEANTLFKKVLQFFKLLPEYEFCWGSRNVQIQTKFFHKGYYDEDIYTRIVEDYDLKKRIPKGFSVYGEIVGPGIQKGYTYGISNDDLKLYVYDVKVLDTWLDFMDFNTFCICFGFETVPIQYVGPWDKNVVERYLTYNPLSDEPNEGLVIKSTVERQTNSLSRLALKWINPEYYDYQDKVDGTDWN
jgi:RNA ligase (TIGR02306 family)